MNVAETGPARVTQSVEVRRPKREANLHVLINRYDGASDLASAESYNPMLNKWTAITPMGTKRSCLGTCSFDGLLYACGGYDGASCLSSMERYDPLTGVWTSCPAMTTRRRYCRIAVVGKQLLLPTGTEENHEHCQDGWSTDGYNLIYRTCSTNMCKGSKWKKGRGNIRTC